MEDTQRVHCYTRNCNRKGVLEAVAGAKRGGGRGEARGAVRWPQAARAGGGEAGCGGEEGVFPVSPWCGWLMVEKKDTLLCGSSNRTAPRMHPPRDHKCGHTTPVPPK